MNRYDLLVASCLAVNTGLRDDSVDHAAQVTYFLDDCLSFELLSTLGWVFASLKMELFCLLKKVVRDCGQLTIALGVTKLLIGVVWVRGVACCTW